MIRRGGSSHYFLLCWWFLNFRVCLHHMKSSPESSSLIGSSGMLMPKSRDHWHRIGVGYKTVESLAITQATLNRTQIDIRSQKTNTCIKGPEPQLSCSFPGRSCHCHTRQEKKTSLVQPLREEQSFHFILCRQFSLCFTADFLTEAWDDKSVGCFHVRMPSSAHWN